MLLSPPLSPRAPRAGRLLRTAQRAWRLLHVDSSLALTLADQALARALERRDAPAEAWARLARGFHLLYFARPNVAAPELRAAQRVFDAIDHRVGHILARTGLARVLWRQGRYDEALKGVLALRNEGLAILRPEQRGLLLNTIAGCYSARNQSDQAFAYMYEALRDAPRLRGNGYNAVLHCNLSHELLQLGEWDQALDRIETALTRFDPAKNPRLANLLWTNRMVALTALERPSEALPDIKRACSLPADASGYGGRNSHFEIMAIAAFGAGEATLGRELVGRARAVEREPIVEEQLELALAEALLARAESDLPRAVAVLDAQRDRLAADNLGVSLRVRCSLLMVHSQLHQAIGNVPAALVALREWQRLAQERAMLASRAHYQAAALQTELLLLRHKQVERQSAITEERARIMNDMHDGIGSQLISMLSLVEHGRAALPEVAAALRECIDDLRLSIDSLQPADADLLPVLGNLRYRLEPRLAAQGIALDWQITDVPKLACLTPQNILHILRILQEAFTNVLKHARADRIAVETGIEPDAGRVYIRVSDNGCGFAAAPSEGHGLANMLRRAKAVGGDLRVGPSAAGTTLELLLPAS